jgi:hypothetical protein
VSLLLNSCSHRLYVQKQGPHYLMCNCLQALHLLMFHYHQPSTPYPSLPHLPHMLLSYADTLRPPVFCEATDYNYMIHNSLCLASMHLGRLAPGLQ